MIEHRKHEISLKREELHASTSLECSQLKSQINHYRQKAEQLQEVYEDAKQQSARLSRLTSSRTANEQEDTLERKFELKKQINQQKNALLRQIEGNLDALQQLVHQRDSYQSMLNCDANQKYASTEAQLQRNQQVGMEWNSKTNSITQLFPRKQLDEASEKEILAKKRIAQDLAIISQLKAKQLDLEATNKGHLREAAKLAAKLEEETSRNEQKEKRLSIRSSEVDEATVNLADLAHQRQEEDVTLEELREGIAYLQEFHDTSLLLNSTRKASCICLWDKCTEVMDRLDQVEQLLLQNSPAIESIHNMCNQSMTQ